MHEYTYMCKCVPCMWKSKADIRDLLLLLSHYSLRQCYSVESRVCLHSWCDYPACSMDPVFAF